MTTAVRSSRCLWKHLVERGDFADPLLEQLIAAFQLLPQPAFGLDVLPKLFCIDLELISTELLERLTCGVVRLHGRTNPTPEARLLWREER